MLKFTARNYARIGMAALTREVPVYAHFGITHRCNLTCKMCGIWRYGNRKEELSLEEIQLVAERMARLGVVQVSIGGGEPFAVDHLEDAAKAFIDQGLNLRILTNGIGEGNGKNVVRDRPYLDRIEAIDSRGRRRRHGRVDGVHVGRDRGRRHLGVVVGVLDAARGRRPHLAICWPDDEGGRYVFAQVPGRLQGHGLPRRPRASAGRSARGG